MHKINRIKGKKDFLFQMNLKWGYNSVKKSQKKQQRSRKGLLALKPSPDP